MKVGVLFSGGKDSCLAFDFVKDKHEVVCLINMKSKNSESYMFHSINSHIVKLQNKALGIPLIIGETKGIKEKELEDLKKLIKKAKKEYQLEGIATGALFSDYQSKRIRNICEELNLEMLSPLWHMDPEHELKELIRRKYNIIIIGVAAEGLGKGFLGKEINEELLEKLKRTKVNLAGEGGEFETLVLNCPLFTKKIVVDEVEIRMDGEYSGVYNIKKAHLE